MKLLSATPSPYARKVRIALAEKGIPFELVTEIPWNDDTATPRYNPLEKLPVLILDSGETVYESRFVLEWLELMHPEPQLYPRERDALIATKRLEVLVDGVLDAFVLHFWERRRPEAMQSRPWLERQMRKIEGGVREIARLVPDDGFCVGGRFGAADIAVGTLAGYLPVRFPEFVWQPHHPNLVALHARLSERPSFQGTVPVPQDLDAARV